MLKPIELLLVKLDLCTWAATATGSILADQDIILGHEDVIEKVQL